MSEEIQMRLVLMVVMAVGCCACSPGSTSTSNTCYDTLVAAAQSCVPVPAMTGELDDAGTTCRYAGGDHVTFNLPESDGISNFVLTSAGNSLCMSYNEVDGGYRTLSTPAGTAVFSGGSITCPDGVDYTGSTPFGNISAYGSGAAAFTLVTADGGLSAFSCTGD